MFIQYFQKVIFRDMEVVSITIRFNGNSRLHYAKGQGVCLGRGDNPLTLHMYRVKQYGNVEWHFAYGHLLVEWKIFLALTSVAQFEKVHNTPPNVLENKYMFSYMVWKYAATKRWLLFSLAYDFGYDVFVCKFNTQFYGFFAVFTVVPSSRC